MPDTLPLTGVSVPCSQQKKMTEKVTTSQLQKDVSNRLRALGISHVEEFRPAHGLFSIDIAFKRGLPDGSTQQIALEVDGPLHFTWNTLKPVFGTLNRSVSLAPASICIPYETPKHHAHLISRASCPSASQHAFLGTLQCVLSTKAECV